MLAEMFSKTGKDLVKTKDMPLDEENLFKEKVMEAWELPSLKEFNRASSSLKMELPEDLTEACTEIDEEERRLAAEE